MTKVIGFAGFSGSGKTTLIERLVPRLEAGGLSVAVIKHDGHGHYKEVAGADSTRFIDAGASAVAVVSPHALHLYERSVSTLHSLIEQWNGRYDLVLVEGFKREPFPKIAVFRSAQQAEVLAQLSERPLALVAKDAGHAPEPPVDIPVYDPDDIEGIACFIERRFLYD
ncbi:molybdopterin-guanine dinucleotide biosynthesis protein B [Paenibacillus allorhizosphaerae]|uniref:Molybdopterin-guanine dinucleotide biosynthesis adapter protein n=1 Tax=Paenibacillus allorhizosphaerae TaxID=2849866 RepID=A0ABM8VN27_9BACL|nr:molybdopterin-guanine dinucleotide biosynthesis protein B [Paenibacillus allorhizosphaerae]CAG7650860.1 Molybdopterin-guanine dinucleotide biosynthesis adapter protein [Paenibacillus allorhizosphaerae]